MTASDVCWRLPQWVGYGVFMWLWIYLIHRWESAEQPRSVFVRPPRWIALLCGNPRRDGSADVEWAGLQLTCFIPMVAMPLVCVLGLPVAFAVALAAWYPVTLVMAFIVGGRAKREHERRDGEGKNGQRD